MEAQRLRWPGCRSKPQARPFSRRQSLPLLTNRREAMSAVEMRRLRLAKANSRPKLRSARTAGRSVEFKLHENDHLGHLSF